MKIAVAGGTGLVGKYVAGELERLGHEAVVLARSRGVDLLSGTELHDVLIGVEAVVDVTSTPETNAEAAREFFGTTTRNLLAAEERAGVAHHVLLSIVNVDGFEGNGHYAGKRRQEEVVASGSVPYTIMRATQFYEFAGMVVGWTRKGFLAVVPSVEMQPVAASDVGRALAELAVGEPQGRVRDLVGPDKQNLTNMARRTMKATGQKVAILPAPGSMFFGKGMPQNALLPGSDARIAETTFDEWLSSLRTVSDKVV